MRAVLSLLPTFIFSFQIAHSSARNCLSSTLRVSIIVAQVWPHQTFLQSSMIPPLSPRRGRWPKHIWKRYFDRFMHACSELYLVSARLFSVCQGDPVGEDEERGGEIERGRPVLRAPERGRGRDVVGYLLGVDDNVERQSLSHACVR